MTHQKDGDGKFLVANHVMIENLNAKKNEN